MKIALVNDWLNEKYGGAEKVLLSLAEIYPEAEIYTLVYRPDNFEKHLSSRYVHTSFLQYFPRFLKKYKKYFLPLTPFAVASLDFSDFDLVISSSGAFVKNIRPQGALHISYCHSPMRFAWDYYPDHLKEQSEPGLLFLLRPGIKLMVKLLRNWDLRGANRVDAFLTNSETSAKRITKYYNRSAKIIHPPVDIQQFNPNPQKDNFYLMLGRLTPYKRVDLSVKACNASQRPLVIAGDGPARGRLEQLAQDNIKFLGYVSEEKKSELLAQAKALIFPNKEDFGIVPIEAMASGTPVVAYRAGGATETVVEDKTGVFFEKQTPEALNQALDKFETKTFDSQTLRQQAEKFSEDRFQREIKEFIDNFWSQNAPNQ